jgi:hypothetical protein
MKRLKVLLVAACAQALAAASWIFFSRSESERAVILWFSPERLLLLIIALLVLVAVLAVAEAAWRSPALAASFHTWLDGLCLGERQLVPCLLALVVGVLLLAAMLAVAFLPTDYAFYGAWAPDTFPLLHSLAVATLPLQLLLAALGLEAAAYLGARYHAALFDRAFWSWRQLGRSLLALAIVALTLFNWLVLAFRLRFFKNNPAWYWSFDPLPFGRGDLLFLLGAAVLMAVAFWLLFIRRAVAPGLITLWALAVFLQFGVGLMSGGLAGFEERYFTSYHRTYVSKAASSSAGLLQSVRQYEQLYGSDSFTETKPPGLMLFYTALDHAVNGYPAHYAADARYERLMAVISFVFPAFAAALVFALYAFARHYVPGPCGTVPDIAVFLLVLCPNFVLFSLFPDQALYPLLFLAGVALIAVVISRQFLLAAFLLGMLLYVAVFFAFTMLPLYPVAGTYLLLHYWSNRGALPLHRFLWMAVAIVLGSLCLYLLFRLVVGYDFFPRFARTMEINHRFDFYLRVGKPLPAGSESAATRLSQILGAAWLNNLDFAAAVGFAVYLLFLAGALGVVIRLFRGNPSPAQPVLTALIVGFIILNLAGTAQGEVPRLWLFWLPAVVLGAALELEPVVARHRWILPALAFAQLLTIFLTFHFQDLRM